MDVAPNHWSGPKNSPVLLPDEKPEPAVSLHPDELVWEVLRVRT